MPTVGVILAVNHLLSTESCLWSLGNLCRLHRIPFARELVLQQFPPPYSQVVLQRATEALGFRSGWRAVTATKLAQLPTPWLALVREVGALNDASAAQGEPLDAAAGSERSTHTLTLVLKCTDSHVAYLRTGESTSLIESREEFAARYAGQVLQAVPRAPALEDADGAIEGAGAFGFRWFVPELLRHKSIWRDVLLASLAIQVLAIATPLFTQVIVDKVIINQTLSTLTVLGIALGIFILFTAGLSWTRQFLLLHAGNRIDAVLGSNVFEHLFKLPPRYFEHRGTGVLVARVQGVETIREFLSSAAVTLLLDVPFLLIFLAIMFLYSVSLTLITVAVLGAIVILSLAVTPSLRARINHQFLLGARNQAFLTEHVAGLETVKSLQLEPQLNQRYGQLLATYLEAGFRTRNLANTYNTVAHALEQTMMLAILCLGAWLVMTSAEFTIGMLVAFQMFASRLAQPMLHLVGLWQQFQQADVAVKRLGDIMNVPPEPYSLTPTREFKADVLVEIRALSFRYAPNLPYLYEGLNLVIKPGQCIALMGPSGSGKSTLAKLLQGFYLPEEGAILLNGLDVRHLTANELRSAFGVVPQDTVLFSTSIYDNLVRANTHATFDQVIHACKLAEIHDTIERLPQGYQTQVGEHGAGLSGGQKQRIAIARALLKRPQILIFDEATSSLDPPTAEQFARTVNRLKGNVTIVFISHQLPKGLHVDSVITLGPHETWMQVVSDERKDG